MADTPADRKQSSPPPSPDRRKFLQLSVQVCGVGAAAAGGYIVANYLAPIPQGLGDQDVSILESELKPGMGVQVLHKGKPVLILRDKEGVLHALSAVCTHLGCLVKWSEADQNIECPCHAAKFGIDGAVLTGPAPQPLPKLPITVEEGVIKLEGA